MAAFLADPPPLPTKGYSLRQRIPEGVNPLVRVATRLLDRNELHIHRGRVTILPLVQPDDIIAVGYPD